MYQPRVISDVILKDKERGASATRIMGALIDKCDRIPRSSAMSDYAVKDRKPAIHLDGNEAALLATSMINRVVTNL